MGGELADRHERSAADDQAYWDRLLVERASSVHREAEPSTEN
jgi:hypothetical protein